MLTQALVGLIAAAAIAFAARAARSLTTSGALAATAIGTLAVTAGWNWGALLILYFVSSTVLSRLGRAEKEERTSSVVAKGGQRDAIQVLANGGVFTLAAIATLIHPDVRWMTLGAGSLAAAAADTWATEIGTLYGRRPLSILSGRRIPTGTSGGISVAGTAASVAGALFIAVVASVGTGVADRGRLMVPVFVAGVAGSLIDSLLGATLQSRRWCETCQRETERHVHDCGTSTSHRRGLGLLNNDVVNLVSTIAGGLLAALLVR